MEDIMDDVDRAQEYELPMFRATLKDKCLKCGVTYESHLLEKGICIDCDIN
jgi:hypothetical protein